MTTIEVSSKNRSELIDITAEVRAAVRESGISTGQVVIFVPHTTAAVTINENADPEVVHDILTALERIVPWEGGYRHGEGNSAAHLKTTLVGASEMILIEEGSLLLGTWQGIYFCEFDGPRRRKVHIRIMAG